MIRRSKVWIPSQDQLVPCSEELDIMEQFDQDNMNLSEETRKRMEPFKEERRSGKERRDHGEFTRYGHIAISDEWKAKRVPNSRKIMDRRGRKSVDDLAEFMRYEKSWNAGWYANETVEIAESILKFLNYE